MGHKVLFVDDDPNILQGYKRNLRKYIKVDTAQGGEQGIEALVNKGPYSVVISDLRMPGMDGVQFLSKVCDISPNTVRIMLSGNADLTDAVEAVNEGKIYRFMLKPCSPETMKIALEAGFNQYNLIIAEKELLEKTLKGSIKILTDVLSLVNPVAFGRASRVKTYVNNIIKILKPAKRWQFEIAAMLSQIGCVTIPIETVEKVYKGGTLTKDEAEMYTNHSIIAKDLVSNIPRLGDIAKIIHYQEKNFDGSGFPEDPIKEDKIPLGSRILKVALDFDTLVSSGQSEETAFIELETREGFYDPAITHALFESIKVDEEKEVFITKELEVYELNEGMILAQDINNRQGALLICKGNEITKPLQKMLENVVRFGKIENKIKVMIKEDSGDDEDADRSAGTKKPTKVRA